MNNIDNCERACLFCGEVQNCKVNYSGVHGLCSRHRMPEWSTVQCIWCNTQVRIMDYLLNTNTNKALEAANTAIGRNNQEEILMKLIDLVQNSQGFRIKVELLCCECKQEEVAFKVCANHGYCQTCIQRISISKECQICNVDSCQCGFRGKNLNSVCNKLYCDTCLEIMRETGHIWQCPKCRTFRDDGQRKCNFCHAPKQEFDHVKCAKQVYKTGMGIYNYFK